MSDLAHRWFRRAKAGAEREGYANPLILASRNIRFRLRALEQGVHMRRNFAIGIIALASVVTFESVTNASAQPPLQTALQNDLGAYLAKRGAVEHISAAAVSVSLASREPNINASAGTTKYGGTQPVSAANLFQIGSNTKAFTSVAILQLEAEHRLTLRDSVGRWLPQYSAWKNVTIRQLLNMTSGILGYDDIPAMLAAYAKAPYRRFSAKELVAYAYPRNGVPPVSRGWAYTNTAYILAQMIVERATHKSYSDEVQRRFLGLRHGLPSTFYAPSCYPRNVSARMVSGYFFSADPGNASLKPLYGRDIKPLSLSWAQGAGAIVSSPEDVTHWVRELYAGRVLEPAQRRELLSIVSDATGKQIPSTTLRDPRGFGLGVGQLTLPSLGTIWYYEGETLGYRMLYAFFPRQNAVIALGLNSQPNAKDDRIGSLLTSLYATLHAAGKM